MRAAGYEVSSVVLTRFRLDGGAMFGSAPKALWDRWIPSDSRNRIPLVARVLLLEGHGRRVLVDAGVGEKFGPKESEMYAIESEPEARLPFRWSELTDLLLTHLHFDHAGGATVRPAPGVEPVLRAPKARVHLQRRNWERALSPGAREKASYLPENVLPLQGAPLELHDGDREALPGIWVQVSNGHTAGLQWVRIGEGREAVVFPADLVPTSTHVHLPIVMGYDMCVETLLREKEAFLDAAVREQWTVVFAHDEKLVACRLSRGKDGRFSTGEAIAI
jgi:glyoxylase-like metal-dependent hydrolase (beta-lactamase superfamily II)